MRATVTIDEGLYRRLKARAGSSGRTYDLVEDAVRDSLGIPAAPPARTDRPRSRDLPPFLARLPTFAGRGGLLPGVDLYDNAGLRDLMDDPD